MVKVVRDVGVNEPSKREGGGGLGFGHDSACGNEERAQCFDGEYDGAVCVPMSANEYHCWTISLFLKM
jgi:hypothetical protein